MNSNSSVRARRLASRKRFTWARLREITIDSFWVVPSLFLVGAVVLSSQLDRLDRAVTTSMWWVGTSESAASVLSTVAASMLTFLGVVFSITLVALQLASQQFSPRVTRTFVRSGITKVAFGVFSATFVTSLLSLSRIQQGAPDARAPVASVTVSMALVAASLVVFIVFVTSITKLIRVANLISEVTEEIRDSLEDAYPTDDAYVDVLAPTEDTHVTHVRVEETGFLRRRSRGILLGIDTSGLARLAAEHDCVIRFTASVGQYVGPGMMLAEIHGERRPPVGRVRRAVQFGRERTLYQDPAYGIRELVDIGCQALSAAVNASTTAVQVIDRLTDVLGRIGMRPDRSGIYADDSGVARIVVPEPSWSDVVDLVYTELRTFGLGSPQVTRRLTASIGQLMELLQTQRWPALERQMALLTEAVTDQWPAESQRSQALQPDPLGLG